MTKTELVSKLAETGGLKKKQAEQILSALVDTIKTSLTNNERVILPGLGSFSCVMRSERTGRNPKTGVEIKIPARKAVKFSAAGAIRSDLNVSAKKGAKGAAKAKPAAKKAAAGKKK